MTDTQKETYVHINDAVNS